MSTEAASLRSMLMREEDVRNLSRYGPNTLPGWAVAVTKHEANLLAVRHRSLAEKSQDSDNSSPSPVAVDKVFNKIVADQRAQITRLELKCDDKEAELVKLRNDKRDTNDLAVKVAEQELEIARAKRSIGELTSEKDEVGRAYKRLREQLPDTRHRDCGVCMQFITLHTTSSNCGHVLCDGCWKRQAGKCPVCSKPVGKLIKLYFP